MPWGGAAEPSLPTWAFASGLSDPTHGASTVPVDAPWVCQRVVITSLFPDR